MTVSILLFLPIVAALVVLFFKNEAAKYVALAFAVAELAIAGIFFICAMWGGQNRIRVNIKFFIYTFAGSLCMLLGIIYLYMQTPSKTYDIHAFYDLASNAHQQSWVFWAFFLAFAIKMPIFPFH